MPRGRSDESWSLGWSYWGGCFFRVERLKDSGFLESKYVKYIDLYPILYVFLFFSEKRVFILVQLEAEISNSDALTTE